MKALALGGLVIACLIGVWWFQGKDQGLSPGLQTDVVESQAETQRELSTPTQGRRTEPGTSTSSTSARAEGPTAAPKSSTETGPTFRVRVISQTRGYEFGNRKRETVIIPNARFQLGAKVFKESSVVLFQGETGPDGSVIVDLPWAAVAELAGNPEARLWGAVREPGYQERTRHIMLPKLQPGPRKVHPLLLQMRVGATIRGTLNDSAGEPCAGTIRSKLPDQMDSFLSDGYGKAGSDGRFELHIERGGPHTLFADGDEFPNTGTATSAAIDIELAAPPQDLALQLIGPGTLRGEVLDAAGQPSAGLQVLALTVKADVGEGSFVVPDEISDQYKRAGRGFYWRLATTDAAGKFAFHGLRADNFVVRARTSQDGPYPILLTPAPVDSTGPSLTLRLSRPHLLVRVVDHVGTPVRVTCPRIHVQEWPDQPVVQVLPAPESNHLYSSYQRMQRGKVVGKGAVTFDLVVDREYMVSVIAPGQRVQTARVAVPEGSGKVEHTFVLNQSQPVGELSIRVLDPEGLPVIDQVRISIVDPLTGVPVASRSSFYAHGGIEPWPAKFSIPQGTYRVEVDSTPWVDSHHGTLMAPRLWGDDQTTVTLGAGDTLELTASLSAPAWIDLEVSGVVTERDREGTLALNPWIGRLAKSDSYEKTLASYACQVKAQLLRPDGYPIAVEFARYAMEGTSGAGTHLFNGLALGSREQSEALPPGEYKLILRLPGGRTESRDIVLTAGSVLPISVDFGAE